MSLERHKLLVEITKLTLMAMQVPDNDREEAYKILESVGECVEDACKPKREMKFPSRLTGA